MSDRYLVIGLYIAFWVVLPIAIAAEILALKSALPVLIKYRDLRTIGNALCASIGIVFMASSTFIISTLLWTR